MNENQLKVFTQAEVNQLLPVLSELISGLQKKRDHVVEIEVEIDTLELVSDHAGEAIPQGLEELITKHHEAIGEFHAIIDQIHSHGCFLKDVDLGLVDFYGIVEGCIVYLCWRLGEEQVSFWHEVGQGYANRKPLITE